ncbi:unnamed protein product [Didymodactylos carnosus]|uniref:Uncharacterized protein n=1 Tax=Didymodactylos carnosus TaxID=1234261 RepID=A0A815LXN9_9BILA|nr:unnamed protein product [Didymodactylos carnosus]CAF4300421.1 unnamed protein product [Didymodactylos carnosus]
MADRKQGQQETFIPGGTQGLCYPVRGRQEASRSKGGGRTNTKSNGQIINPTDRPAPDLPVTRPTQYE